VAAPLVEAFQAARRELELEQAAAEKRAVELTEAERLARDPIGYLNSGEIWIRSKLDPVTGDELRKAQATKLVLFPDQRATIAAWIDLDHLAATGELVFRNIVIDKSRQIGETWAFAGVMHWAIQYHPVVGLAMHEKAAKIDDGGNRSTISSLFGRIRYIDTHISRDRLPGLHRLRFHPFSRDPAKVENPWNGAAIIGEGQTDNPGRGDTYDFGFVDEAAFVQHGEKVHAAIDEACPEGKAYLSTPNGEGNIHARIAKEKPAGWRYLRLHWSSHPVYSKGLHVAGALDGCALCAGNRAGVAWNPTEPRAHRYPGKPTSPWYDRRVIGKTDQQVANELDIDRERSKADRVFPEFRSSVHVVETGIPYEPALHGQLELAADYGLDATSVVVLQDAPAELRIIGLVECGHLFGTSATPRAVAAALRDHLRKLGVPEMLLAHEWTRRMYAIGDPAGHGRELSTGQPTVAAYRREGFYFGKPPARLVKTQVASLTAAKLLFDGFPKPLRICGVNAGAFAEHARENTWRIGPDGRLLGLHDDVHNHSMRAFAYYAVAKFPPLGHDGAAADPFEEREAVPDALEARRARRLEGEPLPYGTAL
jgi:hypothetical protein